MTATSSGTSRTADEHDPIGDSVPGLLSKISQDVSTLVRQELELAKVEAKQETVRSGKAAGLLSAAGLAAAMVLLFLSLALWAGFAVVMHQGLAALLVAVMWGIAAAALYPAGRRRLRRRGPTPPRTAETIKGLPGSPQGHRGDRP